MDFWVCQVFFLDKKKNPLLTRGWLGEALTGVGRTKPTGADSSLYAREPFPHPPPGRSPFPPGEGQGYTRYHRDSSLTLINPIFSYRAMARSLVEATSSRRGTPGQTEAMVCSTYFPAPG